MNSRFSQPPYPPVSRRGGAAARYGQAVAEAGVDQYPPFASGVVARARAAGSGRKASRYVPPPPPPVENPYYDYYDQYVAGMPPPPTHAWDSQEEANAYDLEASIPPAAAAAAAEAAAAAYEETLQAELSRPPNRASAAARYGPNPPWAAAAGAKARSVPPMPRQPPVATASAMDPTAPPFFPHMGSRGIIPSMFNPNHPAMGGGNADEIWNMMFEHLLLYKAKHGHCYVPATYKINPSLGKWVETQRNSTLQPDKRAKLASIGFYNPRPKKPNKGTGSRTGALWEKHWNDMLARLVKYKQKHGHCQVPFHCQEDPQLGYWVKNQRFKKHKLSPERIEKLEKVGFQWDVAAKSQNELWKEMFERLKKFEKIHNHCFVPSRFKEDPKLGNWVHRQRHVFHKLADDRKKMLKTIGFM
mmetsp:Transcript_18507/g.28565  ORF Transcript_18507/g.28565 Transcript_18507/m.28565 type:complete len:415 (+) Transcript_18507:146-1390(+)|eukprot:CAMPEP_0195260698 /NCGR_PEP_ID=MMETSP0706-20130129/8715_1 /TAXON_ID=33640 /ORGANISM="Asterionellopsis glacialis, Strain CCMP134" /LENGTH=414 /DNA_ID=CAMNT_0040314439 /DNA_START=15 /DNA_END=1259 /DNA_ORIENTATION=+